MENNKLEILISDLIGLGPLFKKKLIGNYKLSSTKINHSQFHVLLALKEIGTCPISEVAKKLSISTPNMTKILNKLIDENLINRVHDEVDRRIINISLTDDGNKYLEEEFYNLSDKIREKLLNLDDKQVEELFESVNNLNKILSNIE